MSRPALLVGCCGTGTEVGKTHLSAGMLAALAARGIRVAARKPLQSFAPHERGGTDAEVLAGATGEDPETVCPPAGWFPAPLAPPMAADVLGGSCPDLSEVVASITWPPGVDVGLVETVGGTRSPLASDGDSAALIAALDPDLVVVVADAELGTIDRVRTAAASLAPARPLVVLNRFDEDDDLHRRNRAWLADHDGLEVVTGVAGFTDAVVARLEAASADRPD